jgi:hypothetical protein
MLGRSDIFKCTDLRVNNITGAIAEEQLPRFEALILLQAQ